MICDSYVRPCTLVRICDECNYGSYQGRCVICGGPGVSDAYYCKSCTIQEKDVSFIKSIKENVFFNIFNFNLQRDGCPKIVNLGSSKTDLFYERKKYGFKQKLVLNFIATSINHLTFKSFLFTAINVPKTISFTFLINLYCNLMHIKFYT